MRTDNTRLSAEKKSREYSRTTIYSDIKYDVMIAILGDVFLPCVAWREYRKKKEREREENKMGRASRNLYRIWREREKKSTNQGIHSHLLSIPSSCYKANRHQARWNNNDWSFFLNQLLVQYIKWCSHLIVFSQRDIPNRNKRIDSYLYIQTV